MKSVILIILYCLFFNSLLAQKPLNVQISKNEINFLIHRIADSLAYYYVNKDEGVDIGNHLKNQADKGVYYKWTKPEQLAKKLTQDLRSVNGDLHLYVKYHKKENNQNEGNEVKLNDNKGSSTNYGFQEIQFLEGNIAYLRIEHFSNWDYASKARQKVSEVMSLFKNSKALIIDIRDNRGGVPYIASYLASYFFDDRPVHLADFYTRYNNFRYGIYTEPFVPGVKFPEKPLFILVNEKSASAAEELAFWLQNQKRAIIIGQPTSGAGYGALNHKLNERFSISISSEEEVDPITKKGFQGTGVIPDSIVDNANSFDVAISLAKDRIKKINPIDSLYLKKFYELLKDKNQSLSESEILEYVIILNQTNYLNYDDIYNLGNKYIKEPKKALPILKANTILYPFYPNPFEDYAKALVKAKDYQGALKNFDKAVKLAKLKNNPNLEQFRLNRENFLKKHKLKKKSRKPVPNNVYKQ